MDNEVTHPSFGLLRLSRLHSSEDTALYGSNVTHTNYVVLEVCHSSKSDSLLSRLTSYFRRNSSIVEVALTESQLAQLLTAPNIGEGVPCTLTRINGKRVPSAPPPDALDRFTRQEFVGLLAECEEALKAAAERLSSALTPGGSCTKKELTEILKSVKATQSNLTRNIPYVAKQFSDFIDATVLDATCSINAAAQHNLKEKSSTFSDLDNAIVVEDRT